MGRKDEAAHARLEQFRKMVGDLKTMVSKEYKNPLVVGRVRAACDNVMSDIELLESERSDW